MDLDDIIPDTYVKSVYDIDYMKLYENQKERLHKTIYKTQNLW